MSQESPSGKGGQGTPGDALPTYRKHRRWPIWSEPRAYERTPCNICGFADGHSTVCPFGPEPTRTKGASMIEDDCGGLCFACRLTGLGFDDEQQQIVIQLMQQAKLAGVAWTSVAILGPYPPIPLDYFVDAGAGDVTAATLNMSMANVMRDRTRPVSAEVADAMRGSHQ